MSQQRATIISNMNIQLISTINLSKVGASPQHEPTRSNKKHLQHEGAKAQHNVPRTSLPRVAVWSQDHPTSDIEAQQYPKQVCISQMGVADNNMRQQ